MMGRAVRAQCAGVAEAATAAGCGNNTNNDFDAWAVGGQDFIDVSAFSINAGNSAAGVAIIDTGADTVIRTTPISSP